MRGSFRPDWPVRSVPAFGFPGRASRGKGRSRLFIHRAVEGWKYGNRRAHGAKKSSLHSSSSSRPQFRGPCRHFQLAGAGHEVGNALLGDAQQPGHLILVQALGPIPQGPCEQGQPVMLAAVALAFLQAFQITRYSFEPKSRKLVTEVENKGESGYVDFAEEWRLIWGCVREKV